MTQHTPGPWAIYHSNLPVPEIRAANGANICDLRDNGTNRTSDANAYLIAAAPALLASLIDLLGDGPRFTPSGDCRHCGREYSPDDLPDRCAYELALSIQENIADGGCPGEIARAAIAQATGQ